MAYAILLYPVRHLLMKSPVIKLSIRRTKLNENEKLVKHLRRECWLFPRLRRHALQAKISEPKWHVLPFDTLAEVISMYID